MRNEPLSPKDPTEPLLSMKKLSSPPRDTGRTRESAAAAARADVAAFRKALAAALARRKAAQQRRVAEIDEGCAAEATARTELAELRRRESANAAAAEGLEKELGAVLEELKEMRPQAQAATEENDRLAAALRETEAEVARLRRSAEEYKANTKNGFLRELSCVELLVPKDGGKYLISEWAIESLPRASAGSRGEEVPPLSVDGRRLRSAARPAEYPGGPPSISRLADPELDGPSAVAICNWAWDNIAHFRGPRAPRARVARKARA